MTCAIEEQQVRFLRKKKKTFRDSIYSHYSVQHLHCVIFFYIFIFILFNNNQFTANFDYLHAVIVLFFSIFPQTRNDFIFLISSSASQSAHSTHKTKKYTLAYLWWNIHIYYSPRMTFYKPNSGENFNPMWCFLALIFCSLVNLSSTIFFFLEISILDHESPLYTSLHLRTDCFCLFIRVLYMSICGFLFSTKKDQQGKSICYWRLAKNY